jgi:hypothetical protein
MGEVLYRANFASSNRMPVWRVLHCGWHFDLQASLLLFKLSMTLFVDDKSVIKLFRENLYDSP